MTRVVHDDVFSFYEQEYGEELVVSDAEHKVWLAFETDYGDWLLARVRDEDDEPGPEGDEWRPVGLVHIEHITFPIRVAVVSDVLR